MFDEQNKEAETKLGQREPVDLFKDTEIDGPPVSGPPIPGAVQSPQTGDVFNAPSALETGKIKPVAVPTPREDFSEDGEENAPAHEDADFEIKEPILSKGKIAIIIALAIIVLAGGLFVFFSRYGNNKEDNKKEKPPIEERKDEVQEVQEEEVSAKAPDDIFPPPAQVLPAGPLDSDSDGLSDEEEAKLGTNINSADTDSDGLTDKEEVLLWRTDPLNKDTDGDSYLDGEEVSHNYNPLGPGRLFE